ncbi:type VII secretion protein EccCa [Hoyosella altamirensis]|uniref:S-DNA-T family DNA segregation ATPase FtsK/SpoIIIE n=1 Tax=Hoyosella altamirensis TaxID=616997 RepID=A0A839RRQ3_9ACTN|nr:type VII secretion protein EccCa [Hoyosella altamirensis]MBB3039642.1 S-DNA-T family DNA segregation ATPase FtsK/SpoIIIE [Hoyosella altamirensis]
MGTVQVFRGVRAEPPRMPGGELGLQTPPELPRAVPGSLLQKLLPLVMVLAMLGMVALLFTSGMAANPMMLMFPLMMAVSMLGMLATSGGRGGGARTAELNEQRKDFLRYLSDTREEVVGAAAEQRVSLEWHHPDPAALWTVTGTRRMWERRPEDAEYLSVRIGKGAQRLAMRLVPPETGPTDDLEPISVIALRRFVRAHSVVPDLPVALALRGFASITLVSEEPCHEDSAALVRAALCQLATFHGPDDLLVVIVAGTEQTPRWEWVKWLPHARHPSESDSAGQLRLFVNTLHEAGELIAPLIADRPRFMRNAPVSAGNPHIVLIIDGGTVDGDESLLAGDGIDGVTLIDIGGSCTDLSARKGIVLVSRGGQIGADGPSGTEMFAAADGVSATAAKAFAMTIAKYRLASPGSAPLGTDSDGVLFPDWPTMIGAGDIACFNAEKMWRPRTGRDRLRVPVGFREDGTSVEIDLKESAEGGMGPHGLCVGATGSGKSEFLRTLVLGLIATHSPDSLNLVLVDFKGGATFLGLEGAPHVAAIITNLADELTMVDRMRDALEGEMNRRQQLLRAAGNYANVGEYERARAGGARLEPLPALFIVVDEFSELLSQKPDFADLFVAIGRLGRSLHMHLLLASQRLEEGRLRGLESHLSYRVGLKTFSAQESRAVLGVPDAYHLPPVPGSGYLKIDAAEPVRFSASYVSGKYVPPPLVSQASVRTLSSDLRVRPFLVQRVALSDDGESSRAAPQAEASSVQEPALMEQTVLELVLAGVRGYGPQAHEVWLPPLDKSPTIGQLVPPVNRIFAGKPSRVRTPLRVPLGLIDRPYDQRREPLTIDLSAAQGNMAIVGGPQAGKSTAVSALIMALSATHTPREVQFYCLDFGGGSLGGVSALPHVGSVASRLEPDRVRRTISEITAITRQREQEFKEYGISSMAAYRRLRAQAHEGDSEERAGMPGCGPYGDVFLIVDGWATVRQEFESLEQPITALAAQGLSFGVHVVLTASRWSDFRVGLKDQLGTRIELRLGDPGDSEMNRRAAKSVPENQPGRGLTKEGLHMVVAVPAIDARDTHTADLATVAQAAVEELSHRCGNVSAPPVRMLPTELPREEIITAQPGPDARPSDRLRIPVGIDEAELATVSIDFSSQSHLVVFADAESGKTTLLRSICASIMAQNTPAQAKILLADFRRTMLGVVDTEHLAGYAVSAANLQAMVAELGSHLRARLPGPETTQQQLRDRSWWSGPEVFVIVDDYDLVATSGGNPLSGLLDLLPQAKDVGLHVIVARRAGGASRALFEPVMAALRDLSPIGLVMNGSRDEGVLLGTVRPSALPPGRGTLITRSGGEQLVQLASLPSL